MYLAEKGIDVPLVNVDLYRLEQLSPQFLAINPDGTVSVLETDSGEYLSEAIAICSYLECLHPEPPLLGRGDAGRARVLMWNSIIEHQGLGAIAEILRNLSPGFRHRALPGPADLEQIPALIERGRVRTMQFFDRIEARLAGREFLATDEYSFADISLLATLEFGGWVDLDGTAGRESLARWYRRVRARDSARA